MVSPNSCPAETNYLDKPSERLHLNATAKKTLKTLKGVNNGAGGSVLISLSSAEDLHHRRHLKVGGRD